MLNRSELDILLYPPKIMCKYSLSLRERVGVRGNR
jgi:hypothetical protein